MPRMTLQIITPSTVVLEKTNVCRIVAEGQAGSFGILPARLDGVAILVPGMLLFETEGGVEQYAAVDTGVLIKTGLYVHVAARNAVIAKELGTVRQIVTEQFSFLTEEEKKNRTMLAKIERDFMKHLIEFHKE